jgi:hypothetical protein
MLLPILVLTSVSEGSKVAGLRNCNVFELTQWTAFSIGSLKSTFKKHVRDPSNALADQRW